MNCREAIELLAESGDGKPGPTAGWRFKLHLWCCRNCRNYMHTYNATVRLEKQAYQITDDEATTVPEELLAQIMKAAEENGLTQNR